MTIRIATLFVASAVVAGCASPVATPPAVPASTDVPAALQPPADQEPFLRLHATGAQVYECATSAAAPGAWAWQFRAPDATLADAGGAVVGRHFAGPSWASSDGATVVGQAVASAPAPARGSIPWLLLAIRSREGEGLFAATTSIQRVDTQGGIAPDIACSAANAHQVERVGYVATYVLWRARK